MESMEHLCRCDSSCFGHRLCGAAIATFPPVGVSRELKTQRCMIAYHHQHPWRQVFRRWAVFGLFDVFHFLCWTYNTYLRLLAFSCAPPRRDVKRDLFMPVLTILLAS